MRNHIHNIKNQISAAAKKKSSDSKTERNKDNKIIEEIVRIGDGVPVGRVAVVRWKSSAEAGEMAPI
jgi:hypothetical protein